MNPNVSGILQAHHRAGRHQREILSSARPDTKGRDAIMGIPTVNLDRIFIDTSRSQKNGTHALTACGDDDGVTQEPGVGEPLQENGTARPARLAPAGRGPGLTENVPKKNRTDARGMRCRTSPTEPSGKCA